jgi:hypothetical protein
LSYERGGHRDRAMDPEKLTLWAVVLSLGIAFLIIMVVAV